MSLIPHPSTHTSLDLFEKPSVLVNFDGYNAVETWPTSGVDGPTIEFALSTDRNDYLDLQSLILDVKIVVLAKSGEKLPVDPEGKAKSNIILIPNILQSLFSNCEVSLNGDMIETSNGLYAHKAFLATEWSHTRGCKLSKLVTTGYRYDSNPENPDHELLSDKVNQSEPMHFCGPLVVDFFNCDKLLLPRTTIRVKLVKSPSSFIFQNADTDAYAIKFLSASLRVRQQHVAENVHLSILSTLTNHPARYMYTETHAKTFIIPASQNTFIREDVFDGRSIRRLGIAMNTNVDFSGNPKTSPFHYKTFKLQKIRVIRNGIPVYNLNVSDLSLMYYSTLKNLHFEEDGPDIPLEDYENHFFMVFDMTSVGESNTQIYFPELTGGKIRVEFLFAEPLQKAVEILVLGETLTTILIDQAGTIVKDG